MSDTNDPRSRKTEHKQVFIQGYGQKANVDEGIAFTGHRPYNRASHLSRSR
jgi:hypothetical protein